MHIYLFTDIRTLTSGKTLLLVSLKHIIKKSIYWAVICLATQIYSRHLQH